DVLAAEGVDDLVDREPVGREPIRLHDDLHFLLRAAAKLHFGNARNTLEELPDVVLEEGQVGVNIPIITLGCLEREVNNGLLFSARSTDDRLLNVLRIARYFIQLV